MSLGSDFRDLMMQAAEALPPNTINEAQVQSVATQLDRLNGLMEFGRYVDPITGGIRKLNAGSLILDDQGIRVEGDDTFAVFTGDQTYAGSTVSDGDAVFGNSSADKANIYWDASAGELQFRGGTTQQGWIDTSGAAVFGQGEIQLDQNGIWLEATTDITGSFNLITWSPDITGPGYTYMYTHVAGSAPNRGSWFALTNVGETGSTYPNSLQMITRSYGSSGAGAQYQQGAGGIYANTIHELNVLQESTNSSYGTQEALRLAKYTSGEMSSGWGVGMHFYGAYWQLIGGGPTGVAIPAQKMAAIDAVWNDPTTVGNRLGRLVFSVQNGLYSSERFRIDVSSITFNNDKDDVDTIFYGTTNAVFTIDAAENLPQLTTQSKTSNASGSGGMFAVDGSYLYVHDSTEWRRVALSTF